MSVIAAGSLIAATGAPAAAGTHAGVKPAYTLATMTVTPVKHLVDGQVVTVDLSNFGPTTTIYVAECAGSVLSKKSIKYCDTTNLVTLTGVTGGAATTPFTIHTGTDFKAPKGQCGVPAPACLILASDSLNVKKINYVIFKQLGFKDVRALTKTKLIAKKKVKLGKKLTLVAKTTHGSTKPTGTVTFLDNGKKLKTVKEPATGKAKLKHKFTKKGKQHITVKYSGDFNYKPSKAKEVIVVK
jgi:hypothetical protein